MKDIDQLKNLWKRCFGDPDAFIDLYFRMRYSPENTDVLRDGERIIAQLQRVTYPIEYKGMVMSADYLSGVCTDAAYRNQGLMSRMLRETHRRSFRDGRHLDFLIPAEEWLKGYYARFGYTTCFYTHEQTFSREGRERRKELPRLRLQSVAMEGWPDEEVFSFFHSQLKSKGVAVLHTVEDWSVIVADLALAGGSVWMGMRDGHPVGIAFCLMTDGWLHVKELLAVDRRMEESMVEELMEHFEPERVTIPLGGEQVELGMARIINVPATLELYALTHPNEEIYLSVEGDEMIPENNGHYHLKEGHCYRMETAHRLSRLTDIPSLTRMVMAEHPHMSLMLN